MSYSEIEDFIESKLTGVVQGTEYNQYSCKPIFIAPEPGNEVLFNEIYTYLLKTDLNTIIRTKSGGIAKGPKVLSNNSYAWDLQRSSIGVMLTVLLGGKIYVIKFGTFKGNKAPEIYPSQAFAIFDSRCLDYGINLNDYMITNGPEVKETIEPPLIEMDPEILHQEISNVHHIDFHNSYPAGLANTHPEFRPIIEEFYAQRKIDSKCKAVLNYTIGWMQSHKPKKNRFAEWAHLSRDAIADNNKRIDKLACLLRFSGRKILGFNTDGIWYQGDIYHGPGEGKNLGEWENDHTNCLFRAKSDGVYEFIEDGKYKAVVRGQTLLDSTKPDRSDWTWGDIYKAGVIGWKFDEEKGIYFNEI